MPQQNAQHIHMQKIHQAKAALETNEGTRINPEKIQEWALLDITQQLTAIHHSLMQIMVSVEKARAKI